jgi:histidinol-phosphate/aromatic aminotransferase/cobyric acid decarboxylase-like protein
VDAALRTPSLVIFGSPGNPTGKVVPAADIAALAARHPQSLFVVDEAFADFVPGFASLAGADRPHNVAVLLSLTKSFAVPGLRLVVNAGAGSFKSQLKKADKSGALFALILGEDELNRQVVGVKPLRGDAEQQTVA